MKMKGFCWVTKIMKFMLGVKKWYLEGMMMINRTADFKNVICNFVFTFAPDYAHTQKRKKAAETRALESLRTCMGRSAITCVNGGIARKKRISPL